VGADEVLQGKVMAFDPDGAGLGDGVVDDKAGVSGADCDGLRGLIEWELARDKEKVGGGRTYAIVGGGDGPDPWFVLSDEEVLECLREVKLSVNEVW